MTLKAFTFPSFEEWNETYEYVQKIGDYTCAIDCFDFSSEELDCIAAFANSNNPTSEYVPKVFCSSIRCNISDNKTLKDWYEKVTIQISDKWKNFILDTYFCTEN